METASECAAARRIVHTATFRLRGACSSSKMSVRIVKCLASCARQKLRLYASRHDCNIAWKAWSAAAMLCSDEADEVGVVQAFYLIAVEGQGCAAMLHCRPIKLRLVALISYLTHDLLSCRVGHEMAQRQESR